MITAAVVMIGISNQAACADISSGLGENNALQPRIKRILKVLLPITLPRAMSRSPLIVAATEAATSGRLVPTATMVNPMINSETPRLRAISVAP